MLPAGSNFSSKEIFSVPSFVLLEPLQIKGASCPINYFPLFSFQYQQESGPAGISDTQTCNVSKCLVGR
jgi:hypothetical protein